MTRDDRLRIAVFIDFDNIEIGVKNTLGASFDAGLVLEALKERGDVVSKTAYSDWQRAGGYSRSLTQHAIKMVQRNLTPGGDKNGADINLALDALEMAFTHSHINAFVIVGGDSDFISLVEKLKQYDKKVFVVGGRQFTSVIMQRNCHEFIAYENLIGAVAPANGGGDRRQRGGRVERVPIEQALPLVTRALKVLSEREVSPQLGLLKSTLLQLDSTFSERSYGAGSFRDFVEKLEKVGVVKLQQGKGGWLVTATDEAEAAAASVVTPPAEDVDASESADAPAGRQEPASRASDSGARASGSAPAVIGSNADGLREFRRILASGQVRRWPMYLRNVKQVIRQVNPAFDERAYGFANLVDLLRAAGRDGSVRVDRDRQGVIRVFQGNVAAATPEPTRVVPFDIEDELAAAAAMASAEAVSDETTDESEASDDEAPVEIVDSETVIVVDERAGTVTEYPVPVASADLEHEPGDVNGNVAGGASTAAKRSRRRPAKSAGAATKDKPARSRKRR
ncbi:MAG TPA: NYN domain-containing protein [Vicinamibacterales bacterium]|nr:NYN domain-containing protein [Vicinamibacterales bacterium]